MCCGLGLLWACVSRGAVGLCIVGFRWLVCLDCCRLVGCCGFVSCCGLENLWAAVGLSVADCAG